MYETLNDQHIARSPCSFPVSSFYPARYVSLFLLLIFSRQSPFQSILLQKHQNILGFNSLLLIKVLFVTSSERHLIVFLLIILEFPTTSRRAAKHYVKYSTSSNTLPEHITYQVKCRQWVDIICPFRYDNPVLARGESERLIKTEHTLSTLSNSSSGISFSDSDIGKMKWLFGKTIAMH